MPDSVDKTRTTKPVLDRAVRPSSLPLDLRDQFDEFISHNADQHKQKNLFKQEQFYLKCIFPASKYSVGMDDGWQKRLTSAIDAAVENGETIKGITVKADVNRSQIDDMMRKGTRPRVDTFLKLCKALDISPIYVLTGLEQDTKSYKILSLFGSLETQQQNVFISMMQSFVSALGKPLDTINDEPEHIEHEEFLKGEDGKLDASLLQKASSIIRDQERQLTDRAIFNSEEFDRRLKIEYNKLYLSGSAETPRKADKKV